MKGDELKLCPHILYLCMFILILFQAHFRFSGSISTVSKQDNFFIYHHDRHKHRIYIHYR